LATISALIGNGTDPSDPTDFITRSVHKNDALVVVFLLRGTDPSDPTDFITRSMHKNDALVAIFLLIEGY
jgi:hypothetical protein